MKNIHTASGDVLFYYYFIPLNMAQKGFSFYISLWQVAINSSWAGTIEQVATKLHNFSSSESLTARLELRRTKEQCHYCCQLRKPTYNCQTRASSLPIPFTGGLIDSVWRISHTTLPIVYFDSLNTLSSVSEKTFVLLIFAKIGNFTKCFPLYYSDEWQKICIYAF